MTPHNVENNDERTCPGCGAAESLWAGYERKGFVSKDGELYCCEACAKGEICSCNPERLESFVKRRSG